MPTATASMPCASTHPPPWREIDAQKYLIAVAEKYKIPVEETEVTRENLANYEAMLEDAIRRRKGG